jgi:hypothetical protein
MSKLMDQIICRLPGGYIDKNSVFHQEVELVPLSGREEELLADMAIPGSASLVTTVLSRCIRRIGTISPVSPEVARNLLVADRQYLLLKLREMTFGDQVLATIFCPWPDCGKRVDIDFSLKNIPVRESTNKGPIYKMELSAEASFKDAHSTEYREIFFRLPCGGDQEMISPLLSENEAKALTILLGRCIVGIGPLRSPGEEFTRGLSPLARMEIEREMEAVAPKVEMTMGASCPECGREFAVPFDLQDFFFGELRISRDLLYREVHYLSFHYHWSEREIMEMPREKRRRYIDVLADELERFNSAV